MKASAALRTPGSLGALVGPGGTLTAPADDDVFASVVVPDDEVALEVDVAPVRDAVLGALRAHATQVQHVTAVDDEPALAGVYALSLGVAEPLLATEQYRVAGLDRPGARDGSGRTVPDVGWPAGVRPVA